MTTKTKKVELKIKPLESKVTPFCCPDANLCASYGGTLQVAGEGWGPWGYMQVWDCSFGGKLAAVADY